VYSLATNRMIRTMGLGWALRILGIVSLARSQLCTDSEVGDHVC